ncbi:MAG TPA: ADP-forming succinate--CoA ligase subunit beta [Steroidobacteraceae bacterium]|nr:ADP-forming succinate--CoA ligase subunit beta [Steroidobacteraceae bacterium]
MRALRAWVATTKNLHEYQAKDVFRSYGIPVPSGKVVATPEEAVEAARALGGDVWVVKAQVHAGGRGKAGGVKLAHEIDTVRNAAERMLGKRLVTQQTGPEGLPVSRVYIESGSDIARELYVSLTLNRERGRVAFIASSAGGMDIEEVAHRTPQKILTTTVDPAAGLSAYQARELAFGLGLTGAQIAQFQSLAAALYQLYLEKDLSLVEINPLIVTREGMLVALDAKVNVDDNALFRHPELAQLRDASQEDPMERRAAEHDLNYVSLDGNIACMVNGAGLAMATMDLIKLHGGQPANFLDVGGGATSERVTAAFELILSNSRVRAVLVNIFGGIVRCDLIADGVINAVQKVGVKVPVVVRLEGTNADQAREMLASSGLKITPAADLTDAARKVVALAAKGKA